MPRKKGHKDFIIAAYRRIAMDKRAPSATQLRAIVYLAELLGYREQQPDIGRPPKDIELPTTGTPEEIDEAVELVLQFKRQHGGDQNAAASSQSPSGQPDVRSD